MRSRIQSISYWRERSTVMHIVSQTNSATKLCIPRCSLLMGCTASGELASAAALETFDALRASCRLLGHSLRRCLSVRQDWGRTASEYCSGCGHHVERTESTSVASRHPWAPVQLLMARDGGPWPCQRKSYAWHSHSQQGSPSGGARLGRMSTLASYTTAWWVPTVSACPASTAAHPALWQG